MYLTEPNKTKNVQLNETIYNGSYSFRWGTIIEKKVMGAKQYD